MAIQTTNSVLLIKPANFGYNTETASSNSFQKIVDDSSELQAKALEEFNSMAQVLRASGIDVMVLEDTAIPIKPDAIFPNNWITLHADGKAIQYPMMAENRQLERRADILNQLTSRFEISEVIDLSHYEKENRFLEGTGSMIFDHNHKIAYASISARTDNDVFEKVCNLLNYKAIKFTSYNQTSKKVYHTNVMLSIGTNFAVVCLESISDPRERNTLRQSLISTNHDVIDITLDQMNNFAGNVLELHRSGRKNILVLSESAHNWLTAKQLTSLKAHCELLPIAIPTIEKVGGGSVRCMIAEVFCDYKS